MSERLDGRLSLRNEREDERLGLRRRSFFFFGSLFLAKPEIVVPEPLTYTLLDYQIFECHWSQLRDNDPPPYGAVILRGSDGFVYRQSGIFPMKIGEGDIVKLQQQRGAFRL